MNAIQWDKLRKNITLLQQEVDVECGLVAFLIEKNVLEMCFNAEVEAIPTQEKKVELLLQTLKRLPQEKKSYEYFLEGLRSIGFDDYNKIAATIDATEADSDPSVNARVHPLHYSKKVRQVLNANFKNSHGQTTSLSQVRKVLDNNNVFGRSPWSNIELTEFVCNLFAGIEVDEKPGFLKTRTEIHFKHLARIDIKDKSQSPKASPLNTSQDVNIASLSDSEVIIFLKKEFENKKMSSDSLSEMENQDITGEILLDMSENDLQTVMPSSTFGLRREIKKIIDSYKIKIGNDKSFEHFRPFDSDVKPNDCYIYGNFVDTKIHTRGTKLSPIRNFHLPEHMSDDEIREYIVIHTAIFASACINERQNGTVHFGIAPDETGGRKRGQIEGVHLSLDDLDNRLMTLFFPIQEHLVRNALRNAKYVPIFKDNKFTALPSARHYVIEFDVVPTSSLKEEEYIRINVKDLPDALEKYQSLAPVFKISESGEPKLLSTEESCFNSKIPLSTIKQRGQEEYKKLHPKQGPASLTRLRNHLTGGSSRMEDDIHKVLLLSSPDHSSIDRKSLDFIQNLEPEVVFDFDPRGYYEGVFNALEEQEEVLKVVTLDDFDERKRGQKDIKSLKAELAESNFLHWVFCNGFQDVDQVNATQWNKKRRSAFRKAFNHYLESCHKDRLLIIICLFSYNDILVEACDEILIDLPDQWILLSEQMSDAEKWQEIFKSRNRVDREDLKHRCIIGLPWELVNSNISMWCIHENSPSDCQIPHSSGTPVSVERRKLNEWNDVELLSSLDPIFPDDETFKNKQAQVEKDFYKGGQVQWLNFFSKHVCRRKIHDELLKLVSISLEGRSIEEDNKVLPVYLFHEPGAGGSTSAREILWSLRGKYRCCVMKRFTDHTVEQLIEIFSFKEKSHPEPLLILIDNEDEAQIRVSLEEKLRSSDVCCHTFCVLLICYRTVFVPIGKRKLSMVTLKQFLHKEELAWFEMRYKDLTNRYDNPKSLISFNILKANFEKSFIQKTVREFVKDIVNENEEMILKFVSLHRVRVRAT